ncbi:sodium:glutamate symporter [Saccharopolyspora sp. NPDC000359]|uniref:sodium/glutamate symporter n=1 Tax=Saccharopolyspora sp. NPDC000359 TaxID=3154251 RepID=UPI0033299605
MDYSAWSLLVDAGLIGLLLVVGAVLRATVRLLQTLMVPASVLAGVLGLVLGPEVLGLLPFSDQLGAYSSVLIVVVFACLSLTGDVDLRRLGRSVAGFASYGVLFYAAQVVVGVVLGLLVLGPLFGTHDGFGLLLFAGWAGGFGSAAAMGAVFGEGGWTEAQSLAFTAATVGLLVGIVGGIIQAKVGAKRGWAEEFEGLDALPEHLRTGVLRGDDDRPVVGTHTFSSGSIESLGFQASVVLVVSAAAYGVNVLLGEAFPAVSFPLFSIAFVVGLVLRGLLSATRTSRFVDPESLKSISGSATDVLVVCGIASIVPSFVTGYWLPLLVLFAVGLALCLLLGVVVAPRMLGDAWFEKQVFTWGWATGSVSTGLALLRIIDPRLRSRTLEDFAIAYLPLLPVEVTAVTFTPVLALAGAGWAIAGIWGGIAVLALGVPFLLVRRAPTRDAGRTAQRTG